MEKKPNFSRLDPQIDQQKKLYFREKRRRHALLLRSIYGIYFCGSSFEKSKKKLLEKIIFKNFAFRSDPRESTWCACVEATSNSVLSVSIQAPSPGLLSVSFGHFRRTWRNIVKKFFFSKIKEISELSISGKVNEFLQASPARRVS